MQFTKSWIFIISTMLVTLISVQGCKDSNNEEENDSILGLWLLNSTEGDINYIHITDDVVTFYDYMGDEFDEGPDCYNIGSDEILAVDGNTYTFQDPFDSEATIDVEITAKGNQLTVVQPFGGATFTITFTKSTVSIDTFTPECDEQQLSADRSSFIF